jgi:hypothetical protein
MRFNLNLEIGPFAKEPETGLTAYQVAEEIRAFFSNPVSVPGLNPAILRPDDISVEDSSDQESYVCGDLWISTDTNDLGKNQTLFSLIGEKLREALLAVGVQETEEATLSFEESEPARHYVELW